MDVHIHLLKATGRLDTFAESLLAVSHTAISKITQLLPVKDVDIVLFDNPKQTIDHLGIGGYTPSQHLIYISLNPKKEKFSLHIENDLPRTLAHELHHALRWRNPGYGETLLEAMVSEGLADHFVLEVAKGAPDLWDTALAEDQKRKYFEMAAEEYFNKAYNHRKWFFGSSTIPHWTGYTLGFSLISQYLKNHPDKKASTLYSEKAGAFI